MKNKFNIPVVKFSTTYLSNTIDHYYYYKTRYSRYCRVSIDKNFIGICLVKEDKRI